MRQDDMNQEPRMVNPEEVKNVSALSPEELQQTQVINLKDLEEVVKIEKRTSKKPAIILGIVGLILLIGGSSFQIAMTMRNKKIEEEKIIEHRKEITIKKTHLNCSQTKLNNNGTDIIYSYSYDFEDDKLIKEKKILSAVPTPGNKDGKEAVKKYKDSFKDYLKESPGYTVDIHDTNDGFVLTVDIDYKEFDKTKLNSNQNKNSATSVNYEEGTYKNTILADMDKNKFVCQ